MKSRVIAFIPARGGSKSIPYKNIAQLNGKPLISYAINACKDSRLIDTIVCSTESEKIKKVVQELGIEVVDRPKELAEDASNVIDAVLNYDRLGEFDYILLVQPTSPFVKREHIDKVIQDLRENSEHINCQTISKVTHNNHAWNQRIILEDGTVKFAYEKERLNAYNKQLKAKHYIFGNIIGSRVNELILNKNFFEAPCGCIEIEWPYNIDIDTEQDLIVAEALLKSGLIN